MFGLQESTGAALDIGHIVWLGPLPTEGEGKYLWPDYCEMEAVVDHVE